MPNSLTIQHPRPFIQLTRDEIKRIVHEYVETQTGFTVHTVSLSENYQDSAVYLMKPGEVRDAAKR